MTTSRYTTSTTLVPEFQHDITLAVRIRAGRGGTQLRWQPFQQSAGSLAARDVPLVRGVSRSFATALVARSHVYENKLRDPSTSD